MMVAMMMMATAMMVPRMSAGSCPGGSSTVL